MGAIRLYFLPSWQGGVGGGRSFLTYKLMNSFQNSVQIILDIVIIEPYYFIPQPFNKFLFFPV